MQTPWKSKMLYHVLYESTAINDETRKAVQDELSRWSRDADEAARHLCYEWVYNESIYVNGKVIHPSGTYPKRLGKIMVNTVGKGYSEHPSWQTILNILAANKPVQNECLLGFTQELNWHDGDYGDSGSCYWGEHAHARDMLEYAGSWAVRIYHQHANGPRRRFRDTPYHGRARAWIVPIPWRVYKETGEADGFVLFNGYSTADMRFHDPTRNIANIVANRFGIEVVRMDIQNSCDGNDMIYLNGSGWMLTDSITKPAIARLLSYNDYNVDLAIPRFATDMQCKYDYDDDHYHCCDCNRHLYDDDVFFEDDEAYCEACWSYHYYSCCHCGCTVSKDNDDTYEFDGQSYCYDCWNDKFYVCDDCGRATRKEDSYYVEHNDETLCRECYDDSNI